MATLEEMDLCLEEKTECHDLLFDTDANSTNHGMDVTSINQGKDGGIKANCSSRQNVTNSGTKSVFSKSSLHQMLYKCSLCNHFSEEENLLKIHVESVHKAFENDECVHTALQSDNSNNKLNSNINSNNNDDNDNNNNTDYDNGNDNNNNNRRFECTVCGELFRHKTNFDIHSIIHEHEEFCKYAMTVRRYYCPFCNLSFVTDSGRKSHMTRHRRNEIQSDEKELHTSMSENNEIEIISSQKATYINKLEKIVTDQVKLNKRLNDNIQDVRFINENNRRLCLVCFKKFEDGSDFIDHLRVHTVPGAYLCEMCDLGFITLLDKQHHTSQRHGNGSENKDVDNNKSITSTISMSLKGHDKKISPIAPNTCPLCNKVFLTTDYLTHHLKYDHSDNQKRHVCVECNQCFYTASDLAAHQEQHAKDIINVCNYCGKGFKNSVSFKKHVNTHTRETVYQCPYCSWKFADQSNMSAHVRAKHTFEFRYKCTICGKACLTRYILKQHINTHTKAFRYNCHLCPKSYSNRSMLRNHVNFKHFGKQTLTNCTHCGKQYYSNHLRKHVSSCHSGKRFQCDVCGNSFKTRWCLKTHQATHKKNEQPQTCDTV